MNWTSNEVSGASSSVSLGVRPAVPHPAFTFSLVCPFRGNAGILLKLCSKCLTELCSLTFPWWGVGLGRGVSESPGFPLSGALGPSLCFSPFGHTCCGKRNSMARWVAVPGARESPLSASRCTSTSDELLGVGVGAWGAEQ